MPAPPQPVSDRIPSETDEEEELPEMMIGSMTFVPTINVNVNAGLDPLPSTSSRYKGDRDRDRDRERERERQRRKGSIGIKKEEVDHIELATVERGSRWVRKDDDWVIEGLDEDEQVT